MGSRWHRDWLHVRDKNEGCGLPRQFKPDIPEPDVVLRDEEGIADLDHPVSVDVGLLEQQGVVVRIGLTLQSHDLLEHEEGISLVDLAYPRWRRRRGPG
jgi:hypothetical protein